MIVLATKPRQEEIIAIDDFVWYLCVSYRALHVVTEILSCLIPRCQEILEKFGGSNHSLFYFKLNN